ncbi:MAG: hypothetical protein MKZ70_12885 [Opitutales bacterium]|nr:hypothetical protein [Opitutales bacterium]
MSGSLEGLESQPKTNPVTLSTPSAETGVAAAPNAAVSDFSDEFGPDNQDSVDEARREFITIFACTF